MKGVQFLQQEDQRVDGERREERGPAPGTVLGEWNCSDDRRYSDRRWHFGHAKSDLSPSLVHDAPPLGTGTDRRSSLQTGMMTSTY